MGEIMKIKFLAFIYCVSTLAGDFSELDSLVSSGWNEDALQKVKAAAIDFEQSEEQIAWRLFRDKFDLSLIGEAVLNCHYKSQNLNWFAQMSWDDFERNFGIESDFQLNVSSDDSEWKQLKDQFNLENIGAAVVHARYKWKTETLDWISQKSLQDLKKIFGRKSKLDQLNATSEIYCGQTSPIEEQAKVVGPRISSELDIPNLELVEEPSLLDELNALQEPDQDIDTGAAGSADTKNVRVYFGWGRRAKFVSYTVHSVDELISRMHEMLPSVKLLFAQLPDGMTRVDFHPMFKATQHVKYIEVDQDNFDYLYAKTQQDSEHCYFTSKNIARKRK